MTALPRLWSLSPGDGFRESVKASEAVAAVDELFNV